MSKPLPKSPKFIVASEPPPISEHHVRLPTQLSKILGADAVHRQGLTGKGIRVAVIDSGFFPHPFYEAHGFRITRVPTRKEPEPHVDEYGHGTAQLASLFSVAPKAEALAIKCLDKDPCYSLRKAIALKPHILVCAWGFNIDRPLDPHEEKRTKKLPLEYHPMHRLLLSAYERGICVIAAAGNGQYAFPGNMPEVISAGGVYYNTEGEFTPSDVASHFKSSIFPGRTVPDLCGLVGNLPYGRLLLVPVPPKARLAKRPAFSMIAAGEPTDTQVSGWAMFSGTSGSASMIAGAAALLLQQDPELTPDQIKRVLVHSSRRLSDPAFRVLDVAAALERANLEESDSQEAQDPQELGEEIRLAK